MKEINPAEAKDHVGEKAKVCGTVVSTHYAADLRGQPTFLDLDLPYPDQVFTIVIRGAERSQFGQPEIIYRDQSICVTGKIRKLARVPVVIISHPEQIESQGKGSPKH